MKKKFAHKKNLMKIHNTTLIHCRRWKVENNFHFPSRMSQKHFLEMSFHFILINIYSKKKINCKKKKMKIKKEIVPKALKKLKKKLGKNLIIAIKSLFKN